MPGWCKAKTPVCNIGRSHTLQHYLAHYPPLHQLLLACSQGLLEKLVGKQLFRCLIRTPPRNSRKDLNTFTSYTHPPPPKHTNIITSPKQVRHFKDWIRFHSRINRALNLSLGIVTQKEALLFQPGRPLIHRCATRPTRLHLCNFCREAVNGHERIWRPLGRDVPGEALAGAHPSARPVTAPPSNSSAPRTNREAVSITPGDAPCHRQRRNRRRPLAPHLRPAAGLPVSLAPVVAPSSAYNISAEARREEVGRRHYTKRSPIGCPASRDTVVWAHVEGCCCPASHFRDWLTPPDCCDPSGDGEGKGRDWVPGSGSLYSCRTRRRKGGGVIAEVLSGRGRWPLRDPRHAALLCGHLLQEPRGAERPGPAQAQLLPVSAEGDWRVGPPAGRWVGVPVRFLAVRPSARLLGRKPGCCQTSVLEQSVLEDGHARGAL